MPTRADIAISGLAGLSLLILPFFPEKTLIDRKAAYSQDQSLSLETRQEIAVIFWLDQMSGMAVPVLASNLVDDKEHQTKALQYAWAWSE